MLTALYCDEIAGLKSYPKTNSWKEGTDCCSWDGVSCDHLNAHVIALCSKVATQQQHARNHATELQHASLHYLNLSHTGFVGVVPSQVSHLSKLVSLDLSWIDEQLTIDKYALEGLVHNLTELRHLFLDGIDMFSINPHVFMNLSSSLRSLSLDSCDLQGKFPKNIFDFPNLNLLNLRGNRNLNLDLLKFDRGSNLEHLDLSRMSFSTEWINSIDNLGLKMHIFLEDCLLDRESCILEVFGSLPFQLIRTNSKIFGKPFATHSFRFGMEQIEWTNSIVNSKPNAAGIIENSWKFIRRFHSRRDLSLSSCNLSEFPQFLKELKSLRGLDLSYNRIECKIPRWMQEVRNDSLRYLNVSHNSLTKVEQFPWKNIGTLDLSFNLIVGNLLIPASTINVFFVSNNNFNGEVSTLICNASALRILDFSHNNLSVTIPQCFGNLSNSLEFLNLKKNKFYGTIPPTFAKGCQLSNLNLNGNLLKEPLTPSILNCRGMEVLDLGNNKINDTFLHWLGSLSFLQVLVLKSNHMHGSLRVNSSKSSPFFSKIQIFDLSSNYFSGPLPVTYINSFKAIINLEKKGIARPYMGVQDYTSGFYAYSIGIIMEGQYMELVKIFTMWMIIDLSNNQFEGEIPKVTRKLNLLKGLNLSHNNLNGGIPT
ncbi:receptor-like protein Cf-9 [Gossypium hirsutum]|uniref:Receptor-like protein Cf-9 n=1 Tax=Gossypium hirsutum TaxID=3635 RepID=A0A1U8J0L8_GOSHI|nr:receptor-like protein Cf-9 [Gossypium hirsutum]